MTIISSSVRFLTIVFLFCGSACPAQTVSTHVQDAVFSIRPGSEQYLRYLRYENLFDTATVACTFGEIRLIAGSSIRYIPLSTFAGELKVTTGATGQGEDPVLLPLGTSKPFTIPAEAGVQIGFYRDMEAYIPCGTDRSGPSGGGSGTWEDNHWAVGAGRVQDRTEWVVQIVRADNDKVVGTLDSVGVLPNPATMTVQRYGTIPDRTNHVRPVPSALAGTTVYLRVSPRRYGPTPFGLALNKITSWLSLSTMFEYAPTGKLRCTDADVKYLQNAYFDELLAFTDSTMLATGNTPDVSFITHDSTQSAVYQQRYMTDTVIRDMKLLVVKDSLTFALEYWGTPLVTTGVGPARNRLGSTIYIRNIVPNPTSGNSVQIEFAGIPESAVTLDLYDANGKKAGTLWSGLPTGLVLDLPLGDYRSGMYFLVLTNSNGTRIDAKKLVVRR